MGVGFIFEGNSLQISDFFHSKQDAEQGNPYNCTFTLKINSHGFSGVAPFEYDIRKLRLFSSRLITYIIFVVNAPYSKILDMVVLLHSHELTELAILL